MLKRIFKAILKSTPIVGDISQNIDNQQVDKDSVIKTEKGQINISELIFSIIRLIILFAFLSNHVTMDQLKILVRFLTF